MNSFIQYLLETGICLALFYAGYWVFLRKETFFYLNRIYLIFSIIASFAIPLLNVPSPFLKSYVIERTNNLPQTTGTQTLSLGIVDIVSLIYVLGVGLLLLRFIYQFIQLFVIVRKHGIRKYEGLKIVFMDKKFSPFSFFNIVFMEDSNISKTNLKRIIAHEKVHIKQYHSVDILILELVTIFQWFNPFVWPYKKSLQETHEYLADNGVIAQGFSTAKYQLLMFEQHVGEKLFEFANNFKQSQIKRRLTMMTKIKSKSQAKFKVLLIAPIALLLVLAFAESTPVEKKAQAQMNDAVGTVPSDFDSFAETTQTQEQQEAEEQKRKEAEMKKIELEKEKLAQMKEEAQLLKEKEMKLKEKLKAVEDPEKKAELKKYLEDVLKKEAQLKKEFAKFTAVQEIEGENGPLMIKAEHMKQELLMLMKKEQQIIEKLKAVEDSEKKAELKELLVTVKKKEAAIESELKKVEELMKIEQAKKKEELKKKKEK